MKGKIKTGTRLKVLYLEDSPHDAEIIYELIANSGFSPEMDITATKEEFESFLRANKYDIILSDFKLPGFDAFEALKLRNEIRPVVPFICVSGSIGEETAIELLKLGAVDYVIKDRPGRLPFAIRQALIEAKEKRALRKAEKLLRKSEDKYRRIFENVQDVFYQTDLDGIIQEVSPSIKYFADFQRDEIINTQVSNLYYNPKDRSVLLDTIKRKGEILDYEIILKTKTGKIKYASINARLISDKDGRPDHIDGAIRDVTRRKTAENLLRENENRLRLIVEGTPYLFFYTQNTNAEITYISPSVEKITGYSIKDWYNQKHWFITKNKINEYARERTHAHLKGEFTKGSILLEVEHADKYPILLEIYENPVIIDGTVVGLQGVAHDITEQRRAEEVQRKLSKAVEYSPASVIITNTKGDVEYVNEKFVELSGYTKEEIVGKNLRILKSGYHNHKYYKELWETISAGKDWNGEILNKKKNGSLYWESELISPLENDQGEITHYVAIKEDITERKKMLEDLILAKEKAENSDKIKSEFLAQISHEIRTPLNVIVSYISLLKEEFCTDIKDEHKFVFAGINNASHRIIRTVNLILDMSEIQKNAYSIVPVKLDFFDHIILHVYNEMKYIADLKKIELRIKKLVEDTSIILDEYSVSQILMNLVDNAVKFTQKGYVEIRVSRNSKNLLYVEVEDTGIGIKEEFLDNLFQPFMQEETGYTRRYDGTGLGLSLVKEYCELNNADISVVSKKNAGTTFTVTFN